MASLNRAIPALLFWGVLLTFPAIAGERVDSFPLPGGKQLEMKVPRGWRAASSVRKPEVTVKLSPKIGDRFVVMFTFLPIQPGAPVSTPEGVRALVEQNIQAERASAVQEKIEVVELKGEQGVAYLYHVTDRNPEKGPGDYREATQGAMLLGEYIVRAVILTHTGDDAIVEQAKQALASARITEKP